mgnify:CR=1 FL=1
MALSEPDSGVSAKLKTIMPVGVSSPSDGPASGDGVTCEAFRPTAGTHSLDVGTLAPTLKVASGGAAGHGVGVLISSSAASPARGPASPGSTADLPTTVPPSSGKFAASRIRSARRGVSSRTSLDSVLLMPDVTSRQFYSRLKNAGLWSGGGFWTADISESPSDAVECSLSAVLMKRVSAKYSLSLKAAAGILRRAARRGRALPAPLAAALTALVAATKTTPTS